MTPPLQRAPRQPQRGYMLIAVLALVGMLGIFFLVNGLSATQVRIARDANSAAALAQARDALIGYAITYGDTHFPQVHGYLPCPDINGDLGINPEGSSETCGSADANTIGRLPWKTLGLPVLRDSEGECLWYAVSGTNKNNPPTSRQMNWDNNGLLQVFAADGTLLTPPGNQAVAVLVAPGAAQSGQDRSGANAPLCGGNFTAANYLDNDSIHGINNADIATGKFIQSHEHQDASGNVILSVNDKLVYITKDDIFRQVIRRSDFATRITSLLGNLTPQAQALPVGNIIGPKGTDLLDCNVIAEPDKTFCNNWKEMLFLTELLSPAPITIDGNPSNGPPWNLPNCNRVLIFAGQKTTGQVRLTSADKLNKANYLEGNNLTAFSTPKTPITNFSGASAFSSASPSADVIRCLP